MPQLLNTKPVRILVLEGDGIGPEITAATVEVLREAERMFDLNLQLESEIVGLAALRAGLTCCPDTILPHAKECEAVIMGPAAHGEYPPEDKGGKSAARMLRKDMDLFGNIRPAKSRPGLPPRCGKELDLVIVRENTEGFYADRSMYMGIGEFMPTPDMALAVRKITRQASTRIAELAFRYASIRRRKVTVVGKFNVLRMSDGLFLDCVREVSKKFPDIELEAKNIDAMFALLIRDASQFDVIVTTNMFGDILSDATAEMSGSLGLGASINARADFAMAQAQHGTAPDIAGRNIANPASLIGSAALLLQWLGERRADPTLVQAGRAIDLAIDATISRPECRTRDLGGTLGTREFTDRVIKFLPEVKARSQSI